MLTDFGLTKNVLISNEFDTKSGYSGTPVYCSPERFQGVHNSDKEDSWALGCIAYMLCKFEHPFFIRDSDKLK